MDPWRLQAIMAPLSAEKAGSIGGSFGKRGSNEKEEDARHIYKVLTQNCLPGLLGATEQKGGLRVRNLDTYKPKRSLLT